MNFSVACCVHKIFAIKRFKGSSAYGFDNNSIAIIDIV